MSDWMPRPIPGQGVMRIGTSGTTPRKLRKPKEASTMTRPTIRKIIEDHGLLHKADIIISIIIYVK
jgi:hypothetical protein